MKNHKALLLEGIEGVQDGRRVLLPGGREFKVSEEDLQCSRKGERIPAYFRNGRQVGMVEAHQFIIL